MILKNQKLNQVQYRSSLFFYFVCLGRTFSDWNLDKESSFTKFISKTEEDIAEEEANFDNWERNVAVRVSERFKDKVRGVNN